MFPNGDKKETQRLFVYTALPEMGEILTALLSRWHIAIKSFVQI